MRKCPPALKKILDECAHPLPSPEAMLITAALACVDAKPSPDIFRSVAGHPHGESWCAEFVQALLAYVEETMGVASPLPFTVGVMDLWNRSKNYQASEPKPGSIVVWQRTGSWQGHCGIYIGPASLDLAHWFETVEGNTHGQDDVAHDGDGVYSRLRLKGGSESFKMVGFLNAF